MTTYSHSKYCFPQWTQWFHSRRFWPLLNKGKSWRGHCFPSTFWPCDCHSGARPGRYSKFCQGVG